MHRTLALERRIRSPHHTTLHDCMHGFASNIERSEMRTTRFLQSSHRTNCTSFGQHFCDFSAQISNALALFPYAAQRSALEFALHRITHLLSTAVQATSTEARCSTRFAISLLMHYIDNTQSAVILTLHRAQIALQSLFLTARLISDLFASCIAYSHSLVEFPHTPHHCMHGFART